MNFKKINSKIWAVLIVMLLSCPSFLYAVLPEIESVDAGTVNTEQPDATTLLITTSDNAIINYRQFNIGQNEIVRFIQPSVASRVLNRDLSGNISQILGSLFANGQIILINTAGINIGPQANINVASIIASTLDISDADFLSGKYNFFKAGENAFILNQGSIIVRNGGYVGLLSQAVENKGAILANLGTVVLASGEKTTLALDDLNEISVVIDEAVKESVLGANGEKVLSAVKNSGAITANGGKVILTAKVLNDVFDYAINNTGIINAKSVLDDNGVVELSAEGAPIYNIGKIEAGEVKVEAKDSDFINKGEIITDGSEELPDGGRVSIEAATVLHQGKISANAQENGTAGEIEITSTSSTILDEGSSAEARALGVVGNGGRVLVNSTGGNTVVNKNAIIDVSAGSNIGNAGFIEVSAFDQLGFYGVLNGRAPPGYTGATVLFDPYNIVIFSYGFSDPALPSDQSAGIPDIDFDDPYATADPYNRIDPAALAAAFVDEIYLQATHDIYVNSSLTLDTSLRLYANNIIYINANVTLNSGNFILDAGNDIYVNNPVTVSNGYVDIQADKNINLNANISATGDIYLIADADKNGTGGIEFGGPVTVTPGANYGHYLQLASEDPLLTVDVEAMAVFTGGNYLSLTCTNNGIEINTDIYKAAGINLDAAGNITVNGALSSDTGNIALESGADITVNNDITSNSGRIILTASGSINGDGTTNPNIIASVLYLDAGANIGTTNALYTDIDELWAYAGNSIYLEDIGGLTLKEVIAGGTGSVDITADGDIEVGYVEDPNDVTLTSLNGSIIGLEDYWPNIQTSYLTLFANNGSIYGAYNADSPGYLVTQVATLDAQAGNLIKAWDIGTGEWIDNGYWVDGYWVDGYYDGNGEWVDPVWIDPEWISDPQFITSPVTLNNVATSSNSSGSVDIVTTYDMEVGYVYNPNDVTLTSLNGSIIGLGDGESLNPNIVTSQLTLIANNGDIRGTYQQSYTEIEPGIYEGNYDGYLLTQISTLDAQAGNLIKAWDIGTLELLPVSLNNVVTDDAMDLSIDIVTTYDMEVGYVYDRSDVSLESLYGAIIGRLPENQIIAGEIHLTAHNGIGDVDGIPINTTASNYDSIIARNDNSGSIYIADNYTGDVYFDVENLALGEPIKLTSEGNAYIDYVYSDGGDINLNAAGDLTISGDVSAAGNITYTADNMVLGGTSDAGTNTIKLVQFSDGREIDLGSETEGKLSITSTEINTMTAGKFIIGNTTSGQISVTGVMSFPITSDSGAILHLTTNEGIDDNSGTGSLRGQDKFDVALESVGSITLTNETNRIRRLAAHISGDGESLTYVDRNGLNIRTVDGVNGISTTNGPIDITVNANANVGTTGELEIWDSGVENEVDAGTSTVTLRVRNLGYRLSIKQNASVYGGGGVTLIADDIGIGIVGLVDAGAGTVTIKQFSDGRTINLGSNVAGSLGLTDNEIDQISAGALYIGDAKSGSITVSDTISVSSENCPHLYFTSGDSIVDSTDTIIADELTLSAKNGIGTSRNPFNTNVNTLSAETTEDGADIYIDEEDDLIVDTITAGTEDERGDVEFTAGGWIRDTIGGGGTIHADKLTLTTSGAIGTDSGPLDTDVVTLKATTTSAGTGVYINESDSLLVDNITAGTEEAGRGEVAITADGAIDGLNDDDIADIIGSTVSLTANSGGIGATTALDITTTTSFNADTSSDGSDINIDSIGDLVVGLVDAGSGGANLESTGSIDSLNDDDTADVVGATLNLIAGTGDIGTSGNPLNTAVDTLSAYTTAGGANIYINEVDGIGINTLTTDGSATITANGSSTLGSITTGGDFSFTTSDGAITVLSGTITSRGGGVTLITRGGSILGLGPGPHLIADSDVLLEASGVINFSLDAPFDVLLTGGELEVIIGDAIGGVSGVLSGTTPSGTIIVNTTLPPPGIVYFNGIQIWPPPTTGLSGYIVSQYANSLTFRFLLPQLEQLAAYQVNTFSGAVYLYQPLPPMGMSALEEFILEEGAYELIEGAINIIGHEGLLPILRKIKGEIQPLDKGKGGTIHQ